MRTLEKLAIKNFKSIREQTLALGRLNVFIGAHAFLGPMNSWLTDESRLSGDTRLYAAGTLGYILRHEHDHRDLGS